MDRSKQAKELLETIRAKIKELGGMNKESLDYVTEWTDKLKLDPELYEEVKLQMYGEQAIRREREAKKTKPFLPEDEKAYN